tara:strand:+ start:6494 stop:8131 length:1638 start_codon:yes stop_codon:yes gene_type:complete
MDSKPSTPTASRNAGHGSKEEVVIQGEGTASATPKAFRFGRMFPNQTNQPMSLKLDTCSRIGARMTALPEQARRDSAIPAGYTYFGQFVDHDISFDETEALKREADNPATPEVEPTPLGDLVQKRSPSLDLDSLYGTSSGRDDRLLDGPRFKIGQTTPSPGIGPTDQHLPYDLPRAWAPDSGKTAQRAVIGDPRNDENLAVAQTHLMWLKFHNAVVDQLTANDPGASQMRLFEQSRELVTKHYQFVVLHDFVRRFIDPEVFQSVIKEQKRQFLKAVAGEIAFMPLEFSVAAYRHGHSQVRNTYDWNINFPAGTSFRLLFDFSEVSGTFFGNPTLPTNWIADFSRLYDFTGFQFPNLEGRTPGEMNLAKKIDPFLALPLGNLPEIQPLVAAGLRPFANLAALNLRRGSMRNLPSGQDLVAQIPGAEPIGRTEMRTVLDLQFDAEMEALGLYDRTPLWLYTLLEAAVNGDGEHLGKVGSTIVAETFLSLVLTSRISILTPGAKWTPTDAQPDLGAEAPLDTIPAILAWIDLRDPIIDPLQDIRLRGT